MALAIAILVVAVLLVGFFMLTGMEERSGKRFFARSREKLDAQAEHVYDVAKHVDPGPLAFHALQAAVDYVVHEVAHVFLILVRGLERFLTRSVRSLRGRAEEGTDARTTLAERLERIRAVVKKEETPVE